MSPAQVDHYFEVLKKLAIEDGAVIHVGYDRPEPGWYHITLDRRDSSELVSRRVRFIKSKLEDGRDLTVIEVASKHQSIFVSPYPLLLLSYIFELDD